jgi:hypothetical protein
MIDLATLLFENSQQLNLPMDGIAGSSAETSTKWPLYYALSDELELQEVEFLRLAREQARLNPGVFSFRKVVFTPSKKVYVTASARKTLVHDIANGMVQDGERPEEFISNITMHDDLHSFFEEDHELKFNQEFWSSPPILYHGSSDIDSVLATGIEPRSETRGLNNKHVGDAVFTTSNDEIAQSYGDIVKIDTLAMKRDNYMPFVSEEPEILEHQLIGAISSMLGVDLDHEISDSGIDYDTVIVYGSIPNKYLSAV